MRHKPYVIGITGGIGSGKSVVSRLLRLMDIPVYDCDGEAKRLMIENVTIREALIEAFGDKVYSADGQLDRAFLASSIFSAAERVAMVNRIVHPVVRADFRRWTQQTAKAVVAVESAILFQAGMDSDVDAVWVVQAPEAVRVQRAIQRDAASEEAVRSRMQNQMTEQEYGDRADRVICNAGNVSLIGQVRELLSGISLQ